MSELKRVSGLSAVGAAGLLAIAGLSGESSEVAKPETKGAEVVQAEAVKPEARSAYIPAADIASLNRSVAKIGGAGAQAYGQPLPGSAKFADVIRRVEALTKAVNNAAAERQPTRRLWPSERGKS